METLGHLLKDTFLTCSWSAFLCARKEIPCWGCGVLSAQSFIVSFISRCFKACGPGCVRLDGDLGVFDIGRTRFHSGVSQGLFLAAPPVVEGFFCPPLREATGTQAGPGWTPGAPHVVSFGESPPPLTPASSSAEP